MPSKTYLMGLESPAAVMEYAIEALPVKPRLNFIRRKFDGTVEVGGEKTDGTQFTGSASTRKEALAIAISTAFPVASYPDPQ